MKEVAGKTAFITGGASGMGLGMAKVFSENGMNAAIADIRKDALDEAMTFFLDNKRTARGILLDVTDREAWVRAAEEAEAEFGDVHVLVNNAGVGVLGPMQNATYDDWDFVLGVCLGGVVNGIVTFIPRMLKHGEDCHIVNNTSMSGLFASGQAGLYITAKMGVVGMSEALRSDLQGTNIGVSVYCPGPVHTDLGASSRETRPTSLADTGYGDGRPPLPDGHQRPEVPPGTFMDAIEVGRRVLRGIRRNDIWILSHVEFAAGVKARNDALMRAFPDEPVNERRKAVLEMFGTLLYNPIYEAQSTPEGNADEHGD